MLCCLLIAAGRISCMLQLAWNAEMCFVNNLYDDSLTTASHSFYSCHLSWICSLSSNGKPGVPCSLRGYTTGDTIANIHCPQHQRIWHPYTWFTSGYCVGLRFSIKSGLNLGWVGMGFVWCVQCVCVSVFPLGGCRHLPPLENFLPPLEFTTPA